MSRGIKRAADLPCEVLRVLSAVSKADIAEALVDRLRLDHPDSADDATPEWLAEALLAAVNEQRARRGARPARLRQRRAEARS